MLKIYKSEDLMNIGRVISIQEEGALPLVKDFYGNFYLGYNDFLHHTITFLDSYTGNISNIVYNLE